MSDTEPDPGAALTPEENAFFESGGNSEMPLGEKAAGEAEPDKTEAADKDSQTKVEKMVSLSALHEERGRRKATEAEKRNLENQLSELRGKFSIIEQLNTPPERPFPTVEEDIFGVVRNTTDTVAEIQRRLQADDEQKRADGERSNLINAYRMDAAQFAAKTPDFQAAYNHLMNSRAAELQAIGYDDPIQI